VTVLSWLTGRLKGGAPVVNEGARAQPVPPGQRVYAIGDIHGCAALLDRMHRLIRADLASHPVAEPGIIYLGDYCDRGPDSRGVYQRLIEPAADLPAAIALKGNHEEMFERFIREPDMFQAWRDLGGLETLASYGVDPKLLLMKRDYSAAQEALLVQMPEAHRAFIAGLASSFSWGPYYFCHAGVRPGIPLDKQVPADLLWIRHQFLASQANHGRRVVHGHTPCDEPEVLPNRINVDTGAYATGRLTAAVLDTDGLRWLQT
jgi:serine/threonine protein phosphatase 1